MDHAGKDQDASSMMKKQNLPDVRLVAAFLNVADVRQCLKREMPPLRHKSVDIFNILHRFSMFPHARSSRNCTGIYRHA